MAHRNFCCDGCQTHNFQGRRFHCLRCVNYDLCGYCFDQHVETMDHRVEHPMQLLPGLEPERQQPEILLHGELLDMMHLPNCYTCPYCGTFGHTAKELIDHVVSQHRQAELHVVCPMCAGLPGIELVAIRNLARHLLLNHIEHANLLDPHTPPLRHSLARVPRRRRRQQPPTTNYTNSNPNTNTNNNNNGRSLARSSSRLDSEAGIDMLYQLSELRRLRPEFRASPAAVNYLEGEPRPRPNTLAIAPAELPALNAAPAEMQRSDADRLHLQKWMHEQEQLDLQSALRVSKRRQHRALFTEHLLLSMLCEEQLQLPTSGAEPRATPVQAAEPLDRASDNGSVDNEPGLLSSKYVPSQIMMLMSIPWIRPWTTLQKACFIKLQGATLEDSKLNGIEQQDID
ncbi:CG31835 [Drosophila busckii]|uniref:E3 ubiquitin-protein ligase KCMF1 n=1 Tax=Drosophila busckii TaxID=30019 RepID=A0A0M4EGA0_DROBS|nr:CG31835 [Drosophila busckii]